MKRGLSSILSKAAIVSDGPMGLRIPAPNHAIEIMRLNVAQRAFLVLCIHDDARPVF